MQFGIYLPSRVAPTTELLCATKGVPLEKAELSNHHHQNTKYASSAMCVRMLYGECCSVFSVLTVLNRCAVRRKEGTKNKTIIMYAWAGIANRKRKVCF